jgi:hypothetical protein
MPDPIRRVALVAIALVAIGCSTATTASAPSSDEPEATGPPTACLGLGPADCERARTAALAELTATDPPVIYVQVGGFGCPVDMGCPATLAARPEGDVSIDFDDGAGINVHVVALPDGTIEATRGASMGIAVEPTSGGAAPGPMPYTLGHCGLFSGIDVDGSFWDPVGPIDDDHSDAINSADGIFTPLDPDRASFASKGGLVVALVRHPGTKLLPGCM